MKRTIADILNYRSMMKRKFYIIENLDDEFYVIFGSLYRKTTTGDHLYNRIKRLQEGHIGWDALKSTITINRNEGLEARKDNWWLNLDNALYETEVDVKTLIVDGETIE